MDNRNDSEDVNIVDLADAPLEVSCDFIGVWILVELAKQKKVVRRRIFKVTNLRGTEQRLAYLFTHQMKL